MNQSARDQETERDRYDARARRRLGTGCPLLEEDGAASQPPIIRRPYEVYEELIRQSAAPGVEALDVCCGTGLYSLIAAQAGARLTASDIAPANLEVAAQRAHRAGLALRTVVTDAEHLPFPDGSFELVTCAGSLSYVELTPFLREVHRVLKPNGWLVCVDSLNHNPFYRFNRYLQYRRGRRTVSTLRRMPTLATLREIDRHFALREVHYHGTLTFLGPLLSPWLGEARIAAWLDRFDRHVPFLRRWAFKVVFRAQRRTSFDLPPT